MNREVIPNYVPELIGRERECLKECVDTGWVSSVGPFVDKFEQMFARYHGVERAAAVASGTAAIHLALLRLGVGPGDLVICPTITFIGTVNPIRYCGADPILVDAEERSLNMDLRVLGEFLSSETVRRSDGLRHRKTGRRISALIVVHLYGSAMDMDAVNAIGREYGLPVLEDSAESLGARWGGRLVGTLGDIGCFSFNGNKVITTGGGGMVIARDAAHVQFCKHLSAQARSDPFEFMHDEIGYNYRLSNLCAAIGVAQFEHLHEFIEKKRAHAIHYAEAFGLHSEWEIVQEPPKSYGTYWMVLARRRSSDLPFLPLLRELAAKGIGIRPIWRPIHSIPLYASAIFWGGRTANRLYETVCCLPSSVALTTEQIARVADAMSEISASTSPVRDSRPETGSTRRTMS